MSKPILCVDFDGVIHSYTSGWQGVDNIPDPPVPGALEWLRRAQEHWQVAIYSSRSKELNGRDAMRAWLVHHADVQWGAKMTQSFMHEIEICHEKPPAFLTIDDRAICFQGDWSKLDPVALLRFKPWNKRTGPSPDDVLAQARKLAALYAQRTEDAHPIGWRAELLQATAQLADMVAALDQEDLFPVT